MKAFARLTRGIAVVALTSLIGGAPALAATFVYVSNAEDGDIGTYRCRTRASCNRERASRRRPSSCRWR